MYRYHLNTNLLYLRVEGGARGGGEGGEGVGACIIRLPVVREGRVGKSLAVISLVTKGGRSYTAKYSRGCDAAVLPEKKQPKTKKRSGYSDVSVRVGSLSVHCYSLVSNPRVDEAPSSRENVREAPGRGSHQDKIDLQKLQRRNAKNTNNTINTNTATTPSPPYTNTTTATLPRHHPPLSPQQSPVIRPEVAVNQNDHDLPPPQQPT